MLRIAEGKGHRRLDPGTLWINVCSGQVQVSSGGKRQSLGYAAEKAMACHWLSEHGVTEPQIPGVFSCKKEPDYALSSACLVWYKK